MQVEELKHSTSFAWNVMNGVDFFFFEKKLTGCFAAAFVCLWMISSGTWRLQEALEINSSALFATESSSRTKECHSRPCRFDSLGACRQELWNAREQRQVFKPESELWERTRKRERAQWSLVVSTTVFIDILAASICKTISKQYLIVCRCTQLQGMEG